jgi:hypothetical protein
LTSQSEPHNRLFHWCFFLVLLAYLFVLGRVGLPWAHDYPDPVLNRDVGTLFPYLMSQPNPWRALLGGIIGHVEGPLQYILLNAYCLAIGDLFPLSPATMQTPNTIFAFLAAIVAYLLGRDFFSRRAGYCFAGAFVLSPWLGYVIRQPWYFNTLSCLFEFSTLYFLLMFMTDPDSRVARVTFPASFFGYLLGGLDWPSFCGILFVFLLLSGKFPVVLRNRYNVIPLLAVLYFVVLTIYCYVVHGLGSTWHTLVLKPFYKGFMESRPVASWDMVWQTTFLPWGLQLPFAIAGMGIYLTRIREEWTANKVGRSFLDSACLWLVVGSLPLIRSCHDISYLYVLSVPTTILAGLALSRIQERFIAVCALACVFTQFFVVSEGGFFCKNDERHRVLAAACFVIEQRPDLLTVDKKAMTTANVYYEQRKGYGALAMRYMRGGNQRFAFYPDLPAKTDSKPPYDRPQYHEAHRFVDTYNSQGRILADWIMLETYVLTDANPAKEFYVRLLHDPNVRWIARFREKNGEEILIGEVSQGGAVPLDSVPVMDVEALSETYRAKYDRMSFLKRNMDRIRHY